MRAHELLNFWIGVPLFAVDFVAADVKKLVGEKLRHLFNESIEKLICTLPRRIHRRIEHTPLALNRVRPRRTGEVRISNEPCSTVSRYIEFRNHSNSSVMRVGDHIAHLFLGIEQSVRSHPLE